MKVAIVSDRSPTSWHLVSIGFDAYACQDPHESHGQCVANDYRACMWDRHARVAIEKLTSPYSIGHQEDCFCSRFDFLRRAEYRGR